MFVPSDSYIQAILIADDEPRQITLKQGANPEQIDKYTGSGAATRASTS